ncbi:hypothetical protein VB711_22205 [Cronbergia sp. UHCC 0137]|uniref:hypothetical protein n=1 Tax=Cronbergia sp. UHCC 0137 TaxID=3110239 RepID=UPI002B21139E|nr:hypothetical protein [Cronbergia sp. UHCC 0137]MEA5620530.1 hypothetical protein [Cronbergia sp. UHCC 0137]
MKNKNFSNQLVLQNNPTTEIVISGLITTIMAVVSLSITYLSLPKSSIFSCDRIAGNQINCDFKQNTLWLNSQQITFVDQPTAAVVAPLSGEDNDLYLVILKTAKSSNFTLIGYNSETPAKSIASQINYFINNPRQNNLQIRLNLELKISTLLPGLLFFTISLAFLIAMIFIPFYRKITFDKTTNQIIINQKGWVKDNIIKYKISDIVELRKEETIDQSDDSKIEYILLLSGNKRIRLFFYQGKDWENELEMVENIANFLNFPITHQKIKS